MIYRHDDYKEILLERIKKEDLSMKNLALQIGVQATYFSKFFHNESTNLNDDHLFQLCQILDFNQHEIDYIFHLKDHQTSSDQNRRDYLKRKIEQFRKEMKLNTKDVEAPVDQLEEEMKYLLDPLCILVHLALYIDQFKKNPQAIGHQMNITSQKLKTILGILLSNGFIEIGEDLYDIKKVNNQRIHYGKNHPLMRVHQSILKTSINSQLLKTAEESKHSFLVTFNTDDHGFNQIKEEFQKFIKSVEGIAIKSKPNGVYQLNFDLFKWL